MFKILKKKPLCFIVSFSEVVKNNQNLKLGVDFISKKIGLKGGKK